MEKGDIKDLEAVIQPYLGENVEITDYETSPLTQPGENYGSVLTAIVFKARNTKDGAQQTIHVACKTNPKSEWTKRMFNTPIAFKRESAIYSTISQTIREFEEENQVERLWTMFPKHYGSRLSLNPSADLADDDAVLLLENLKVAGFSTPDKTIGFDLESAEAVIKCLARFHSIPVALKLKKKQVFEENILPYLKKVPAFCDVSDRVAVGMRENIVEAAALNEKCVPYLDAIRQSYIEGEKRFKFTSDIREPFATICHNDFWTNNVLIKRENNRVVDVKILDFQMMEYGSPAKDLIFFLYSSVQIPVLSQYCDELIKLYYNTFIQTLETFKCNLTGFEFNQFQQEISYEAYHSQFQHVGIMLSPIYKKKEAVNNPEHAGEDILLDTNYSEGYYERLWFIVQDFVKRGWLVK